MSLSRWQSVILLALSAAFVGLVHSAAPGHWLPVVLIAKSRKWPARKALLGALISGLGHIFISSMVGLVSIFLGVTFLTAYESTIERYAGLGLILLGLLFAAISYLGHSSCEGHGSLGILENFGGRIGAKGSGRRPFLFLFSLGLSPCVAILPVFVAASAKGIFATFLTLLMYSVGVVSALGGMTLLTSLGLMKFEHKILRHIFEHYGDAATGFATALMGVVIFFLST